MLFPYSYAALLMKLLPIILSLLTGCVTTTYRHGDIVVTRSHLLSDEKASFALVRVSDGSVMILGNASSAPDAASIQTFASMAFFVMRLLPIP